MAAHFLTDFRMANFVSFSAFKDLLCDHVFLIIVHESIELCMLLLHGLKINFKVWLG